MDLKFGTSGLRGLATDLTGGAAARYAAAFARHLIASGRAAEGDIVYVGRDLRESSPQIAADVWRGVLAAGLRPVDCDALPTPALAFHAGRHERACVMVTGSHIPADRNGLKFYRPDGEIDKDDEASIARLAEEPFDAADAASLEGIEDSQDAALRSYRARYDGLLAADALKGMRIGIYEHSSVAREIVAGIVAGFGAEIVPLGRSETFVPVDTEAVEPETVEQMKGWARVSALDAILSTDGDGDRPLVADETGMPVRGDALGLIAARHLGADTVVTPVTSNSGIERRGFEVVRTRVGSPYVIAGMTEAVARGRRAVIGFEANGGLMTASVLNVGEAELAPLPTRDSVLPMLCVLGEAARTGQPISQVVAGLDLPVAASGRLKDYAAGRSAALISWLRADGGNAAAFVSGLGTVARIDDTDGVQLFLGDGGMIHFRPSGNAPEMRCYAEAPSAERARQLLEAGLSRLQDYRPSA